MDLPSSEYVYTISALEAEEKAVEEAGKQELFARPSYRLLQFVYDRYIRGDQIFAWRCNPEALTDEERSLPVLIFLPGQGGRVGNWAPQIHRLRESGIKNAFFYASNETSLEEEIKRIQELGGSSFILIGHSLGAIRSAEYAFSEGEKPPIHAVISLAGRLKPYRENIPFPNYAADVLPRVEKLWNSFEAYKGETELVTISGETDWLVPRESSDVGDERYLIENRGHLGVLFSKKVTAILIHKIVEASY